MKCYCWKCLIVASKNEKKLRYVELGVYARNFENAEKEIKKVCGDEFTPLEYLGWEEAN